MIEKVVDRIDKHLVEKFNPLAPETIVDRWIEWKYTHVSRTVIPPGYTHTEYTITRCSYSYVARVLAKRVALWRACYNSRTMIYTPTQKLTAQTAGDAV